MRQQEELEAFRQFQAANGQAIWEGVLEARRQPELAAQLDGRHALSESSARCSPGTIWGQQG